MAQPPLSRWSWSSGRAVLPPECQSDIVRTLQETLTTFASWCQSVWRDFTQTVKERYNQEERIVLGTVPSRKVRVMDHSIPDSSYSADMQSFMPRAPPPLAERRFLGERPMSLRPRQRTLSWSEEQINTLQEENRKLRQEIISQKRVDAEKDQIIAMLRQHNYHVNQELSRQNEAVTKLASMAVAIQNPGPLPLSRPASYRSGSLDHGVVDEIIQIYRNI